jgi:hypothetical protein
MRLDFAERARETLVFDCDRTRDASPVALTVVDDASAEGQAALSLGARLLRPRLLLDSRHRDRIGARSLPGRGGALCAPFHVGGNAGRRLAAGVRWGGRTGSCGNRCEVCLVRRPLAPLLARVEHGHASPPAGGGVVRAGDGVLGSAALHGIRRAGAIQPAACAQDPSNLAHRSHIAQRNHDLVIGREHPRLGAL